MRTAQVGIIGGGVVGSALARELSQYQIKTIVFEKGSDVVTGASKANSGVIHSGINSPPQSLKAQFCVQGNKLFNHLAQDLSLPFKKSGKFIVAKTEDEIKCLHQLKKIGEKNGVPRLQVIDNNQVKKKEKNVKCKAALWVPSASITSPFLYTIALAENAVSNGVKYQLSTIVNGLQKKKNFFHVFTNKGMFMVEVLVNSAGIHCKDIVSMIDKPDFDVYPCRGQYLVLDKKYSSLVTSMIYPLPEIKRGVLGIHITPTVDGNILLGPSAEYIKDPEDTATTREVMRTIYQESTQILPGIPQDGVINAFSGVRCKLTSPQVTGTTDFKIEESHRINGMINLIGIESPGLTAAPAIAKHVINLLSRYLSLKKKKDFYPRRRENKLFAMMSLGEQSAHIKKDSSWGNIICRCEHVTEAEVVEALLNPLNAHTLSSVRYRCRAGMGRCQGGFCTQHIIRIMQEKMGIPIKKITLKSPSSKCFVGRTRNKDNE